MDVGTLLGIDEGTADGMLVGIQVGTFVGAPDGTLDGTLVGIL